MILDTIRQRYVRLTPEEWVRQHFLHYLMRDLGFPKGLLAIEKTFPYEGMPWRADAVAYSRQGQPLLLIECKAPTIAITQATFDQIARYNTIVAAPYLAVTNGRDHYCCRIDHTAQQYTFLDILPAYSTLTLTP